jgi:hypothetical protein
MPINVPQGDQVEFTVVFFDAKGGTTVPSSGTLSIVYTDSVSGSTAATSISLVPSGSFFIGTWDSSTSALGFANYSAAAPGLLNNPAVSGQLRIIRP